MLDLKIMEKIIESVYEKRSLNMTLKEMKVSASSFYETLNQNPHLLGKYERAQESRAELLVDEILEISDSDENPQKVRNQVDARRWYASKMKPKKFGDKLDLNIQQTLDIRAAIADAQNRLTARDVGPLLDIGQTASTQLLDMIREQTPQTTGHESVDEPQSNENEERPLNKEMDDLLG